MKKLPVSSALLAVILSLTYFSPNLRADETKPPIARSDGPIPVNQPPAKLINVNFPGGTVTQFVALIANSDCGTFNVIGEKEEMEVQLPPISFHNAELVGLANALSVLLRQRGLIFGATSHDLHTYTLSRDENFHRYAAGDPARSAFESFQLKPFLTDHSVDDVVAAIRAGWELDPAHDRSALRIKFHPPTSVLLVSGPSDAIMLTKDILGQIKQSTEKKLAANSKDASPTDAEKK